VWYKDNTVEQPTEAWLQYGFLANYQVPLLAVIVRLRQSPSATAGVINYKPPHPLLQLIVLWPFQSGVVMTFCQGRRIAVGDSGGSDGVIVVHKLLLSDGPDRGHGVPHAAVAGWLLCGLEEGVELGSLYSCVLGARMNILSRVVDPHWILQWLWIRIRIGNSDLGAGSTGKKMKKNQYRYFFS
jgi:hypothetical protein